jgi:integrase
MLLAAAAGRAPGDPLFVDARGARMSRNVARKLVLRACLAAEVPEVPPQALRRTHATLASAAGETGYAVARALGHSTGSAPKVTTQSYLGREAVEAAQGERLLRVIRGGRS